MTREEAIEIIEFKLGRGKEAERFGLRNCGVSNWIGTISEEREALEMAISALSENKVAKTENTTVYVLKAILKHGHCYCDSENLSAYKAIKNAIEIITSLERLKAEIEDIDPITIIGAEIKQEILDIIDKYIGDKAE